MATALVLVAGAGVAAFMLAGQGKSPGRPAAGSQGSSPRLKAEAVAREHAVSWILRQVSPAAIVACDTQVCADLAEQGYSNTLTLRPGSNDPLGSDLVVATAAIRAEYGARLASVYAPLVVASFGSGTAKIEIRQVYPGGTKKFRRVEPSALRSRKTADAQLLTNRHVQVSATARAQLLTGRIDPILPQLIAAMAHLHPVRIVDFVNQSPGGAPASLLRSVDLATFDRAAHLSRAGYLEWIRSWVDSQRAQFRPAWSYRVTLRPGEVVLRIGYSAPSPLG